MQPIRLQRTSDGYKTDQISITQEELSPRQAQFAAYAIGHAMEYKEVGQNMGLTHGSVKQLAKQLLYKLEAKNILQAANQLYKRGLLKHLCALLFIGLTVTPQADASNLYRRPPGRYRQHRITRVKRTKRDTWSDLIDQLQPQ
jgi:DNA-binding CsgD family transcriptional regulator